MYKRLTILSIVIITAMSGLAWLGYHSIQIRAQGMEGARIGEFAEVAEQIRLDVKRKFDSFIKAEINRPYTDYQSFYVTQNPDPRVQTPLSIVASPLNYKIEEGLAYGHFQIEPDGKLITPNDEPARQKKIAKLNDDFVAMVGGNRSNIIDNLLPALDGNGSSLLSSSEIRLRQETQRKEQEQSQQRSYHSKKSFSKSNRPYQQRKQELQIESLKEQIGNTQMLNISRSVVNTNRAVTEGNIDEQALKQYQFQQTAEQPATKSQGSEIPPQKDVQMGLEDIVQVRIEPFVSMVVGGGDIQNSLFEGQIFLLRHVQIEQQHFMQGFQLNEVQLLSEIRNSAMLLMREGMAFNISKYENADTSFAARLEFGFGSLVLNLIETDPAWIQNQTRQLVNWYLAIIAVVLLVVSLGLASLWQNTKQQLKLAQKKDDFISAVSHELRTPLTSIRMYSEMLEKNWIKSEEKRCEYYQNMRTESERLSRLIENVLDFSRIQRGRKKYSFTVGDINQAINEVIEMMRPYASRHEFTLKTDFADLRQTAFDRDAIKQITVNLIDNAVKYARKTKDKTIIIRSRRTDGFILIEVEDHGPGIPFTQRHKVFEEFYRTEAESTRETAGTGLGLALVKKFAQAHEGFVEILSAKPTGALFRVGLAIQSKHQMQGSA